MKDVRTWIPKLSNHIAERSANSMTRNTHGIGLTTTNVECMVGHTYDPK